MKLFKTPSFNEQFTRTVGYVTRQGASLGECLAVAARIKDGDYDSWYTEWNALAEQNFAKAKAALKRETRWTTAGAFLRASNYLRTAIFFLRTKHDPRILTALDRISEAFSEAMALMPFLCSYVALPYEHGQVLYGYWCTPDDKDVKRPTIIIVGGYDSCAEELYFLGGAAALERGYNCLFFDGPGQGRALYRDHLTLRHDWEKVINPIIDHLERFSTVDQRKIIIMGRSLGGHLVLRAAAYETRLAAIVADPANFDLSRMVAQRMPRIIKVVRSYLGSTFAEALIEVYMGFNKELAFSLKSRMLVHGAESIQQYFSMIDKYTLAPILRRVAFPLFIAESDNDPLSTGQGREMFDLLRQTKKNYFLAKKEEGMMGHCQSLSQNLFEEELFDWLDKTIVWRNVRNTIYYDDRETYYGILEPDEHVSMDEWHA